MYAIAGFLACMAATIALAAPPSEPSPIYLSGYYRIYDRNSVWQYSDSKPWYILKDAPWADPRLLKWGYVPVRHDAQRYYCLVDHEPPTGSHIPEWTFACGDPATVELLYNSNRAPVGLLYGGPH
jgi:hypothetical protein